MRDAIDPLDAFGVDEGRFMEHRTPVNDTVSHREDTLEERTIPERVDDFLQDSDVIDVGFDYVNLVLVDETNVDGGLLRFQSLAEDVQDMVPIAQDGCLYRGRTAIECQHEVLHGLWCD